MFSTIRASGQGSAYAALAEEDDVLISLLPPVNREGSQRNKGDKSAESSEATTGDEHANDKVSSKAASTERVHKDDSVTSCYVELNGRTVAVVNTKIKSAAIVLGRYGGKAVNFACLGKCPIMSRNHGRILYDEKRRCYALTCLSDRRK